jgi:hypothetical protein
MGPSGCLNLREQIAFKVGVVVMISMESFSLTIRHFGRYCSRETNLEKILQAHIRSVRIEMQ